MYSTRPLSFHTPVWKWMGILDKYFLVIILCSFFSTYLWWLKVLLFSCSCLITKLYRTWMCAVRWLMVFSHFLWSLVPVRWRNVWKNKLSKKTVNSKKRVKHVGFISSKQLLKDFFSLYFLIFSFRPNNRVVPFWREWKDQIFNLSDRLPVFSLSHRYSSNIELFLIAGK